MVPGGLPCPGPRLNLPYPVSGARRRPRGARERRVPPEWLPGGGGALLESVRVSPCLQANPLRAPPAPACSVQVSQPDRG